MDESDPVLAALEEAAHALDEVDNNFYREETKLWLLQEAMRAIVKAIQIDYKRRNHPKT